MRVTWLPDVLRAAGLTVHLYAGWETRGVDKFGPLRGVICHATASSRTSTPEGDCRVLWETGSVTAPAPISQMYLGRDGAWTVGATGKCNHVLTGDKGPHKGYGNVNLLGIEAANDNRGEPWSPVMLDSYQRGVAAICAHERWESWRVVAHTEHQTGKSDPLGIDMNAFRRQVDALLAGGPRQEEGMRLIKSPSTTVWLAPDALQGGKPVMIPLLDTAKIDHWRALGVPFVTSTVEPNPQYCFITEVNAPWPYPDPVELTKEQFAELQAATEAAAKEGAEAGSLTHEEVVAAVNEAEDR